MIHIVFQDGIEDCPDYQVFQQEFIGNKVAGEIQLQIERAAKEQKWLLPYPNGRPMPMPMMDANCNCFESRFAWLFEKITQIKACRNAFKCQEETNKSWLVIFNRVPNIFEVMLESRAKTLKLRQHQLLLGIRITLQESCVVVDV